jgi:hypothetical protein
VTAAGTLRRKLRKGGQLRSASISQQRTSALNSNGNKNNRRVPRFRKDVSSEKTIGAELPLMYSEKDRKADTD